MPAGMPANLTVKWISMHYFWLFVISAASILIPLAAAIARKNRLTKRYLPFFWVLITGTVNESVSYLMIRWLRNNQFNSNLYTLIEYLLLLLLFYQIKEQRKIWLIAASSIGLAVWFTDNLWLHELHHSNASFRIFSSMVIIWLSINKITILVLNGVTDPYKKTDLLLCFSFFTYYTYRSFILLFKTFSPDQHSGFYTDLWLLLGLLNIIIHITFTIAILWIPPPQKLTPSS